MRSKFEIIREIHKGPNPDTGDAPTVRKSVNSQKNKDGSD